MNEHAEAPPAVYRLTVTMKIAISPRVACEYRLVAEGPDGSTLRSEWTNREILIELLRRVHIEERLLKDFSDMIAGAREYSFGSVLLSASGLAVLQLRSRQ